MRSLRGEVMEKQPILYPLTFRAPWTAPAFFALLLLLIGGAVMAGFYVVGLPWQAQCFMIAMIAFGLFLSTEIALYRLCLTEKGIAEYRFIGWQHHEWSDVVGWTKWGDNNLLFIKLQNGRTIGTDRPGFGEKEIAILAEALSEKAAPMARGDQSVLPWYLEWTVGGLMRAGPPT